MARPWKEFSDTNASVLGLAVRALVVFPVWLFFAAAFPIRLRDYATSANAGVLVFGAILWAAGGITAYFTVIYFRS